MYIATLVLTPTAVMFLRYHVLHPPTGSHPGVLDEIAFIFPLFLSLVLALACWYYRPLKNEQIASTETPKADSAAN